LIRLAATSAAIATTAADFLGVIEVFLIFGTELFPALFALEEILRLLPVDAVGRGTGWRSLGAWPLTFGKRGACFVEVGLFVGREGFTGTVALVEFFGLVPVDGGVGGLAEG
jgi:hypothetical protein